MTEQKNPAPGSLRKELNEEEAEWLKNFNASYEKNYTRAAEKIVPEGKTVTDVIKEHNERHNKRRADIYYGHKAVHITPETQAWDAAFDNFVVGDENVEHYVDDPTLNPKYPKRAKNTKYSNADYCKPGIPDEDGLIEAIDAERADVEARKIKQFTRKGK